MNTPIRNPKRLWTFASALAFAAVPLLPAQTAPATTAVPEPVASDTATEEPLQLSPFTVNSTQDADTYQVQDTLAGTRIRTKLSDLGSAITVVNSKFMSDIQATNAETLLQYTTNTEVGGMYGNFGGMGNNSTISESARLLAPNNDTRVRGLAAADNTRNYFLSSIPWDSFNIDRVDMQRGPNSMLFGNGSPAGIINSSLNDAMYRTEVKVQNRVGSYGSLRNVVDVNYVVRPKELAVRVVGLDDNQKYRQDGTFNHAKRVYGALKYEPKWLDFQNAHTSIKINDEYGTVSSRNPRTLPPVDQITPWFNTLNKITVNPYVAHQTNGVAGGTNSPNLIPYLNTIMGRQDWSNVVFTYPNAGSSAPSLISESYDLGTPYGIGVSNNSDHSVPTRTTFPITGAIPGGIAFAQPVGIATYSQYAVFAKLPGSQYGVYRDKMLTDPSIYDFYNNTLDGRS